METVPFDHAENAYNSGSALVAFDLETTGLNPGTDRIAEIGAVKFDNKGLIARFSTLVNPGIPMPPEAGRVNKITDEMLSGKPEIGEVLPDFLRFIGEAALIAHNAPFDCGFINAKLETPLPNPVVDTLLVSKRLFPSLQSHSLQNLAASLGISAVNAHRAEDDARLCMEIFLRCVGKKPSLC